MIARPRRAETRGMLMAEMVVAMSILVIAVIPLAFGFIQEQKLCRNYYRRAVLMEILDGELEVLAAGAWKAAPEGTHPFTPQAEAVTNLPPGKFSITRADHRLRLEWFPASGAKPAVREIAAP
ncbi:MAG TPA: hypothetical protein VI454_20930 [Verrucomicrobiae bacterium]